MAIPLDSLLGPVLDQNTEFARQVTEFARENGELRKENALLKAAISQSQDDRTSVKGQGEAGAVLIGLLEKAGPPAPKPISAHACSPTATPPGPFGPQIADALHEEILGRLDVMEYQAAFAVADRLKSALEANEASVSAESAVSYYMLLAQVEVYRAMESIPQGASPDLTEAQRLLNQANHAIARKNTNGD